MPICNGIPCGYRSKLDIRETECAIKLTKDTLERKLAEQLDLIRVSAPLFVLPHSGLNDDLNGTERPVAFDVPGIGETVEVVHSLAKWKRMALQRYGFPMGIGLYTDMNAIRRDEEPDALHSIYVDQWDWEKTIPDSARNEQTLKTAVRAIVTALVQTQHLVCAMYPKLDPFLSDQVTFLTTQELLDRYPDLTPKQREDAVTREYGTVFLMQIGKPLSNGFPHDGRAPDYDDWELNGDLLVWYPVLERAVELSSMGIRVDAETLVSQLTQAGRRERLALDFHKKLLHGELPQTMGGGIGQSRICMLLLEKAHIGEVQASLWPKKMMDDCEQAGIHLL